MRTLLIPALLFPFVACSTPKNSEAQPAPVQAAATGSSGSAAPAAPAAAKLLDEAKYDQFGAGAHAGPTVDVATILKDPLAYDGKEVRFSGPIQSVCQTKGCWMRIGDQPNVFVKFKDYAFFMPKDSAGRTAVVEGQLKVKVVSVEEARHYLEDAGKHEEAKKITEPVKEVTFMATGVAIAKR